MNGGVLVTDLRRICGHDSRSVDGCVTCEAADRIEAVADLVEKLAPIDEAAEFAMFDEWPDNAPCEIVLTAGQLRAFRAALRRVQGK